MASIGERSPTGLDRARLTHLRLLTGDVPRMARFYAEILARAADLHGDECAEVPAPGCAVSFFRTDAMDRLAPGAVKGRCQPQHARRSPLPEDLVAVDPQDELGFRRLTRTVAWNRGLFSATDRGGPAPFRTRRAGGRRTRPRAGSRCMSTG